MAYTSLDIINDIHTGDSTPKLAKGQAEPPSKEDLKLEEKDISLAPEQIEAAHAFYKMATSLFTIKNCKFYIPQTDKELKLSLEELPKVKDNWDGAFNDTEPNVDDKYWEKWIKKLFQAGKTVHASTIINKLNDLGDNEIGGHLLRSMNHFARINAKSENEYFNVFNLNKWKEKADIFKNVYGGYFSNFLKDPFPETVNVGIKGQYVNGLVDLINKLFQTKIQKISIPKGMENKKFEVAAKQQTEPLVNKLKKSGLLGGLIASFAKGLLKEAILFQEELDEKKNENNEDSDNNIEENSSEEKDQTNDSDNEDNTDSEEQNAENDASIEENNEATDEPANDTTDSQPADAQNVPFAKDLAKDILVNVIKSNNTTDLSANIQDWTSLSDSDKVVSSQKSVMNSITGLDKTNFNQLLDQLDETTLSNYFNNFNIPGMDYVDVNTLQTFLQGIIDTSPDTPTDTKDLFSNILEPYASAYYAVKNGKAVDTANECIKTVNNQNIIKLSVVLEDLNDDEIQEIAKTNKDALNNLYKFSGNTASSNIIEDIIKEKFGVSSGKPTEDIAAYIRKEAAKNPNGPMAELEKNWKSDHQIESDAKYQKTLDLFKSSVTTARQLQNMLNHPETSTIPLNDLFDLISNKMFQAKQESVTPLMEWDMNTGDNFATNCPAFADYLKTEQQNRKLDKKDISQYEINMSQDEQVILWNNMPIFNSIEEENAWKTSNNCIITASKVDTSKKESISSVANQLLQLLR